ncbi:hypothetical protein D3C80_1058190 [compost metagenome]
MEEGDVAQFLRRLVEQVEQAAGRAGDVDRDDRRLVSAGQRSGGDGPFGVGQPAFGVDAGQAAGREHDDATFGLERRLGGLEGGAGLLARALGGDPFDRDDGLRQAGRDPQGVGVGEIDQVVAHRAQGVVHGQAVGDARGVVADHQATARGAHPVQGLGPHLQLQQGGDVVQRLTAGHGADGVGHAPRLGVVQQAVEGGADQGPGGRSRQPRRALGDQDVDDVGSWAHRLLVAEAAAAGKRHPAWRRRHGRLCRKPDHS